MSPRMPTWSQLGANPATMRRLVNLWPPFRFAGIRVTDLADDWSRAVVELRLRALTRNYMGTQFGGSMFSMTDPFWVVLVLNRIGPGYVVWDKRAEIDFLRPGRTDVRTVFIADDQLIAQLRQEAEAGAPVLHWLSNDIVDRDGQVVARVRRQLYVRKVTAQPAPAPNPEQP